MWIPAAVVLLVAWFLAVVGVYSIGSLAHLLLLPGIVALFTGVLKARDRVVSRRFD